MEELIPIASKLQDVLGALGQNTNLDLPQIVVIGGQSSGKSSVLESVVGRSFLPRGTGIVTRRPLVLQLFNTAGPDSKNEDDENERTENDEEDDEKKMVYSDDGLTSSTFRRTQRSRASLNKSNEESTTTSQEGREWGEFLHQPGRQYFNFSDIRHEIVADTARLTGPSSKGINPTPIHLKIYSPKVLSLTMVDLPGLTKVAVHDQPADIERQIYDLNVQYGSNPNAILLAVTSANTDLASSDALKLARELDPLGERTIGVLTKLDLMDPGTDASEILLNKVIPLRRGYIGTVNRGQRDIDADLSIQVGLRNEERFFRTHPIYSRNRSLMSKLGTSNLSRHLNGILISHIRECLPELKMRITGMMGDVQSELDVLGSPEDENDGEGNRSAQGGKLLGLLSKFTSNFAAMIDGRASNTNQHHDGMPSLSSGGGRGGGYGNSMGGIGAGMNNMSIDGPYSNHASSNNNSSVIGTNADELYGGARISHIFHQVFGRSLNSVGAFDGLSEEEIRTTIGNANGTRPALFVPEISFDILVRRQIRRLEEPGVQCVDLVYDELQRIANQSEPTELTRYPNLRDRMMDVIGALLKRSVGPTQMWVSNLVRVEMSYINTNHPDFIGGSKAVARLMEKMANEKEVAAQQAAAAAMNTGNQPNQLMTPVKERPSSREEDIGATPLSSSSLEKYMVADDGYTNSNHGAPPQHVVVDRSGNSNGDNGGIMNFIFRGNNSSSGSVSGGIKGNSSWNNNANSNRGKPMNSRSNNSHYNTSGGPPTIVQLPQVPDTMRQTDAPPSDRERVETEIIKSLIDSYFSIVRKNYIDMVPKTIMYFLVNHVKDEMQNELVSELYREAEVSFLMKEADDIALRRRTCLEMRGLLSKALEIVNEVRDFNTYTK